MILSFLLKETVTFTFQEHETVILNVDIDNVKRFFFSPWKS